VAHQSASTSDPFEPQPFGDGGTGGCLFWGLILVPPRPIGRRSRAYGPRFGIPLYRSFNPEKARYNLVVDAVSQPDLGAMVSEFHEMVHWQQFCATSIGALLVSIRARMYDWIGSWSELPVSAQKKVARWRSSGKRPFPLTASHRAEQAHLPDEMVPFSNIWWEYNWASNLFLNGLFSKEDISGMATGNIIGNVLGDIAIETLDDDKRPEANWLFALRNLYTSSGWDWLTRGLAKPENAFDLGWDVVVGYLSSELTTRDLLEAGAVLHELRYAMHLDASAAAMTKPRAGRHLRERIKDPYFKAIRVFSDYLKLEDPGVVATSDPLRLGFLSLLDLSLNPPVPPFLSLPEGRDNWPAVQLYPPARFSILCATLGERGADSLPTTLLEVPDFESELCEVTGLAVAGQFEPPWAGRTPYDLIAVENQGLKATAQLSFLDYWMAVQRRYWELRNQYLGFGIDYLGAVRLDDDPLVGMTKLDILHGAHCLPLLQVGPFLKKVQILPALGMENLQSHLLSLSVRDSLLDQVFTSAGPVSLRHYPQQIVESSHWREDFEAYFNDLFPYMPVKVAQS
jgi:hypothetical protein